MSAIEPCSRPFALRLGVALAVVVPLLLSSISGRALAQVVCDPEYPCSYEIANPGIQRVPGLLKFQARISQAKLPVGDAVLADVEVHLIDAVGDRKCSESFSGVRVRNSVLNLEIGHNMTDCSLDDVVATAAGLSFQVCIGGGCLKPIPLGSAPYAFKANYALQAQESYVADRAAQAHYAHRMTADRDMMVSNSIGKGYFDFHTPDPEDGGTAYDASSFVPYEAGGFIQWFPVAESNPTLNICAGDLANGYIQPLSELVLYAVDTTMRGNTEVEGSGVVQGSLTVNAGSTVNAGLTVNDSATVNQGLTVNDSATVNQGLTVTDTAASGADLVCAGDTQVVGHSTLEGGATVFNGLTVIDNDLSTADLVNQGDAQVVGHSTMDGGATVSQGATVNEGLIVTDTATSGADLVCAGDTQVLGHSYLEGGATIDQGATVNNGATINNGATVNEGLKVTDTAASGADLVCAGDTQVVGHSTLEGGATVTAGLTVNDDGTAAVDFISSGEAYFAKQVEADGLAQFNAGARVHGNIQSYDHTYAHGGLTVAAASTAAPDLVCQGTAQFDNDATFGNEPDDSVLTVYSTVHFKGQVNLDNPLSGTVGRNRVDSDAIIDGTIAAVDLGTDALNAVRALIIGIQSTDLTAVDSGTTSTLYDVAVSSDGLLWVAVGALGTILTSTDAVTWETQTSGTTYPLRRVAHNGSQWVAVGLYGTILTSSDGETWTSQSSGVSAPLYGVDHDAAGLWVVVGYSGTILSSSDGATWESVNSPTSGKLIGVAHDKKGKWLAVATSGAGATSSDGSTWTYAYTGFRGNNVIHDGAGLWVAGTVGGIMTSPSGDYGTWKKSVGPEVQSIACDASGACLAAVEQTDGERGELIRTHDRITWTTRPSGSMSAMRGAAVANRFVLVGDDGAILISRAF
jgi:hypothetical protein